MTLASDLSVSSMVASDLDTIWETFEKNGNFENSPSLGLFEHGAIASTVTVEPGTSRTVTFVLSWHFPNRVVAQELIGNAYINTYRSASDVSDDVIRRLPSIWRSLQSWDLLTSGTSLPTSIEDELRNSLAQLYKTSFCSTDGRWRSWDSFSDPVLSSMDMNLYRALPLLYFGPEMLTSLLRAFAAAQAPDGSIPNNLGNGQRYSIDEQVRKSSLQPVNNGATPAFFILSFALFKTTGSQAFLKEMWPHLLKAMSWQLSITTTEGLPSNLPALSDWASEDQENLLLQDAVLHLTGLQALLQMAEVINRTQDVPHLKPLVSAGTKSLQTIFSSSSGYRHFAKEVQEIDQLNADRHIFSGFLWASMLNLDESFDNAQVSGFLERISKNNDPALLPHQSKKRRTPVHVDSFMPANAMSWAALNVLHSKSHTESFDVLSKLHDHQRTELADSWGHYEFLSVADGLPTANPHHASHLSIWFTLASLTGQRYDASQKRLSFSPRMGNGTSLPFFIPHAKGLLIAQKSGKFILQVVSGRLELKQLEIGQNILYRDILLEEGQMIELKPHN